jgi:hypothetical protein
MQLQRGVWIAMVLLSLGMHWQHLRKDLISIHVWRQTQTQATVRAFYEEDMHILHPRRDERGDGEGLFLMEFPLMQWTVAAIWKVTGPQLWEQVIHVSVFLPGRPCPGKAGQMAHGFGMGRPGCRLGFAFFTVLLLPRV